MNINSQNKINVMHRSATKDNTYTSLSGDGLASILVSGNDTDGAFCVVHCVAQKKHQPPLHIHEKDDETFYVLEGKLTFFVGDTTITAKAGDYVFAPRGIPHTFKVDSHEASFVVTGYPAGFDSFVKEVSIPYQEGMTFHEAPPSPEMLQRFIDISKKYNISYPKGL